MYNFADKLRLLKKKFNVKTDQELADKLEITVFAVRSWKQRGVLPAEYELLIVEKNNKVDLDNLELSIVNLKENQNSFNYAFLPPEIQDMLQDYQVLTEEEKEIYRMKIKRDALNVKLQDKD